MVVDPRQDIGEPSARVNIVELGGGDQGVDGGRTLAAAVRSHEQPGLAADGDAAQGAFGGVVRQVNPAVAEEAGEAFPAGQHVVHAVAAEAALTAFEAGPWGRKYAAIGQSWRRAWGEVVPFYAFHVDVRRLLYTTNAIEALNAKLRRAVRARGHFPTDEAALKLLFLVLNRAEKEWIMPPREWAMTKAQFAVLFGDRFARAMA